MHNYEFILSALRKICFIINTGWSSAIFLPFCHLLDLKHSVDSMRELYHVKINSCNFSWRFSKYTTWKKQSLERMLTYTTKTLKPYLNLVDEATSTQDTYFSSKIFIVPTSENPLRFGKIAFLWVIVNEQDPLKYNKV